MAPIRTSTKYGYSTQAAWDRPVGTEGPVTLLLEVDGASDAHVWLSDGTSSTTRGYEVVIGGWKNTRSEIRRGQQGTQLLACELHRDGPLQAGSMRKFWLSIIPKKEESVTIVLGAGWEPWKQKILVGVDKAARRIDRIEAAYVSTGFGSEGVWEVLTDSLEPPVVKSESATARTVSVTPPSRPIFKQSIRDTIVVASSHTPVGLLKRPRSAAPEEPVSSGVSVRPTELERRSITADLARTIVKHEPKRRRK